MAAVSPPPSTGLSGLDEVLEGLRLGDNIVLQVDSIDDYIPFVKPYCEQALREGRKLIYFRFAHHEPLLADDSGAEIVRLDPQVGLPILHCSVTATGRRRWPRSATRHSFCSTFIGIAASSTCIR